MALCAILSLVTTAADPAIKEVPRRRRAGRARRRVAELPRAVWVLAGMVLLYVAVFGHLTWAHQANYGTFGFDMGIYDQGIWLMSRFEDPFITVRGLPYFGHHLNLITVLLVPAYWLGAGPIFLYQVETVTLALGAVPLWLFARDRWGHDWAALVPAGAFLLYPSTQWINWWHFHPDALIITPLLFAWWFASRGRWGWFWIAVGLALSAKEDAAMAIFVLGLVVAWRGDRRRGLLASGAALGWFFLATRVVIPALTDGQGPFYGEFFADFGTGSTLEIAREMATHPGQVVDLLTDGERLGYYGHLLTPVGFTALLGPAGLAVGVPQLLVNALSSHSHTHDAMFHYSSVVTAGVFLGVVDGLGRLARFARRWPFRVAVVGLVAASVWATVVWGPSPIGREYDSGVWARHPGPRQHVLDTALTLVPDDAGVTATYYIVPHLTHRRYVYEWPNPFVSAYWGVSGEDPHPPERADFLVVDTHLIGPEHRPLFDRLVVTDYRIILESEGIVVAEREGRM